MSAGANGALRARRHWLAAAAALLAAPALALQKAAGPLVEVWKSPSCGCCKDWISHIEAAGFSSKVHDVGNNAMRGRLKVPQALGSCHTALVGGYAIEGHVPAREIRRLLAEKPAAVGLAVPGMPIGSPGMDGPVYGDQHDPYEVLLILKDGSTRVFARYPGKPA